MPLASRPGVQALAFHVMRWMGGAEAVRVLLAPRTPPPRVESLLITAIALLWPDADPPYPDHTLVDQAVTAARERTPAAAAFVNAVLRRFLRERAALVTALDRELSARLRDGRIEATAEGPVMEHLTASLRATLAASNPRFDLSDAIA